MESLVEVLKARHLTLSCCESFTGGAFASTLCRVPGVSAVFLGGIIAYSNQVKETLVGVDKKILEEQGAVSPETVREMAIKTRYLIGSDLCVAFSGNAGPSASEGQPVGTWYMAISFGDKTEIFGYQNHLERNDLRAYAIEQAENRLLRILQEST